MTRMAARFGTVAISFAADHGGEETGIAADDMVNVEHEDDPCSL